MRCRGAASTTWADATPPDGLRLRARNPGPPGLLGRERGGLLPWPCGVDGRVLGLRPDGELARGLLGPGARRADRTRPTGRRMEAAAHHGSAGDIPAWRPLAAGLPLGTARLRRLPVDAAGAHRIAVARPPLVTRRPAGWAHASHLVQGLRGDAPRGLARAPSEPGHPGPERARGPVSLTERPPDTRRGGRRRGHDAGAQGGRILFPGVGAGPLGADPAEPTLRAIPGLARSGGGEPRGLSLRARGGSPPGAMPGQAPPDVQTVRRSSSGSSLAASSGREVFVPGTSPPVSLSSWVPEAPT